MATFQSEDLQVGVITDIGGFTQLEPQWRALAERCDAGTVFQTYEWNAAWWRHFGRSFGRALQIVTVRDGQDLIGLAPCMTSFWYCTPFRRLSFIGIGASDYQDILAASGSEDRVAAAVYRFWESRGGWHVIDWQQLREGGILRTRLPQDLFQNSSKLNCHDVLQEPCPFLPLPDQWETLTHQFGKKTRSNISYYDRAIHKIYEVAIGPVTDEEELDDQLARLFELHQRRWNQRWLPGVFGSRRVQAFHRDAARSLLRQGWLRLFTLRLDDETEACLYCFAYRDRMCYYQGGFEPTLAKYSLGTVLTARAIQTAIGEGLRVFDFLRGDEPYKAKWTQQSHQNLRRLITRRWSPLGPWVRAVQRLENIVETRVKEWARKK